MSLADCIQLAWENNLQMQSTVLNVASSEAELKSARENLLPNLNGFASHNYNWGQRIDPFTNQFANTRVQSNSFGLSSSVNLFNGFQNRSNIASNEANVAASSFSLEAQKNDMALSVASAYLMVLMTEELIRTAEQQVQITRRQLDRVVQLVEAGSANVGMQYDLEAQLARDESNLAQRQNDQALAMLQLKQMMVLPVSESISLEKPAALNDEEKVQLESAAAVYSYAESSMPEIKAAESSIKSWEQRIKAAQSGRYPSLSLSGSIGTGYSGLSSTVTQVTQTGTEPIGTTASGELVYVPTFESELQRKAFGTQLSDNFNQFIGLSLNVPLYNRGAVTNAVKQAEINRQQAEIQLELEKQGLRQRIESARLDAVAARKLYEANQKAVAAASNALDFATKRFEAGALNVVDFNNAKDNLLVAEATLIQSRYDLFFKSKVLDFYLGKPLSF